MIANIGRYVRPGPAFIHERQVLDIHGFFQDVIHLFYDTNLLVLVGISAVQLNVRSFKTNHQNVVRISNNLKLTFILTFFHTFVA